MEWNGNAHPDENEDHNAGFKDRLRRSALTMFLVTVEDCIVASSTGIVAELVTEGCVADYSPGP